MKCLVIQPIHQDGIDILERYGLKILRPSATSMEVVAAEIGDAVAVVTRNMGLAGKAMDAAPQLKVIGNHGTGYDRVDVQHATSLGIPFVNTPYANVQSVAEHAISQIMAVAKRTREADKAVRGDRFDYRYEPDFHELSGRTLGVMGFGRIGRRTAEIAKLGFGMKILVHSPSMPEEEIRAAGMEPVGDLDEFLSRVDVVSLHQRLTQKTHNLLDRTRLARLKRGAILVNTARGALIDTEALIEAVESGHLLGAAIDVFEPEPPPANHPYLACRRIVLSPHIGGATIEAMQRTAVVVAQQVINVLEGRQPEWLVNPSVWEHRR